MKNTKFLFIIIVFLVFVSTGFSQNQLKPLPIKVTFRKSFLGGSYVLQIKNISNSHLRIWLDARERNANFSIRSHRMKAIGWAQGFRFDANDIFFIGAEGFQTYKGVMPMHELSDVRFGFSQDGSLTINLSQSYLQKQLRKYLKLPMKKKYPKIIEIEINEVPRIILRDRANRIYANVVLQSTTFSGKVHLPINVTVSFVPSYLPSTGVLLASQIYVENLNIINLPDTWFNEIKNILNRILPVWFSKFKIFQLDKSTLKYCKFFNVSKMSIHKGRLEIKIL